MGRYNDVSPDSWANYYAGEQAKQNEKANKAAGYGLAAIFVIGLGIAALTTISGNSQPDDSAGNATVTANPNITNSPNVTAAATLSALYTVSQTMSQNLTEVAEAAIEMASENATVATAAAGLSTAATIGATVGVGALVGFGLYKGYQWLTSKPNETMDIENGLRSNRLIS